MMCLQAGSFKFAFCPVGTLYSIPGKSVVNAHLIPAGSFANKINIVYGKTHSGLFASKEKVITPVEYICRLYDT